MGVCENRELKMSSNRDNKDATKLSKESHQSEQRFNPGPMRCPRNNEIVSMCVSPECRAQALSCSSSSCPTCSKLHPECTHKALTQVTEMIQKRISQHHDLMKKMQQIQVKMVQDIVKRRKANFQRLFKRGVSERYSCIIDAIYFKKNDLIIQGRQALQFYDKLKKTNSDIGEVQTELVRKYEEEMRQEADKLTQIQNQILDQYLAKCKIEFRDNSKPAKKVGSQPSLINLQPHSMPTLNSNILHEEDVATITFVSEALNHPKRIKLIFRASDYSFKAEKFHQLCDGIRHTFTLILTEYNKVIGGYTPLTWNETQGFGHDKSQKSFLLSVDLKQKMTLTRPEKAIQCIPTYGPVFGGGADIAVSDNCDQNNNSCVNFAYSYNCNKQYGYNQAAWKALCGVSDGKYFKIKEYEVYEVSW